MILRTENLEKSFVQGSKKIEVLKGAEFSVSAGQTVAILGKSGSGKSTLLSLLCGIETSDGGNVYYESQGLADLTEDELAELRASHIGVIFQQYHLVEHLTALENVRLPLEIGGRKGATTEAIELLEKVDMGHRQTHFPAQLSGGEKQRVAIARALASSPKVLLADEPSGSLDEHTGAEVMDLIFSLVADTSMALVLVTHDKELASRCGRTLHLEDGVLKADQSA